MTNKKIFGESLSADDETVELFRKKSNDILKLKIIYCLRNSTIMMRSDYFGKLYLTVPKHSKLKKICLVGKLVKIEFLHCYALMLMEVTC